MTYKGQITFEKVEIIVTKTWILYYKKEKEYYVAKENTYGQMWKYTKDMTMVKTIEFLENKIIGIKPMDLNKVRVLNKRNKIDKRKTIMKLIKVLIELLEVK